MNANVLVAKKGHIPFFSERKAARENFRFTFTQVYIVLTVLMAICGIYYVWILNQNATKGYNVRELQVKNRELSFQENLLDIRIAEGQSIGTVMNSPIISTMLPVETSDYIVVSGQPYLEKE